MEKKVNIAKLLKDAPQDYEVDSPIFGKVRIRKGDNDPDYPIDIAYDLSSTGECITKLTCYGTLTTEFKDAPCVIFPKGAKTWENFSASWMKNYREEENHKFFKPFQKVLVATRDEDSIERWIPDIYLCYSKISGAHRTMACCHFVSDDDILPYEGNEDKLGKEVE